MAFYSSSKKKNNSSTLKYPLVSILKPLRGIDDDMGTNIETFFNLDYPDYEILFGIDSLDDPECSIIQDISERYPEIEVKIIETGHSTTVNPKIHKLSILEQYSRGSLYWVSDSNIRVEPDKLKSLVNEYSQNGINLVFSPIKGWGCKSIGSMMENSYFSHYLSGNVLGAWTLFGKELVVGKSMLIEKKALNSFGGFAYFKDYIAEDQIIGETFKKCGFKVSTNYIWVKSYSSNATIKSFYDRISRWAKLRYNMHKYLYFGEILTNSTIAIIFGMVLLASSFLMPLLIFFCIRIFLEFLCLLKTNGDENGFFKTVGYLPFIVALKDIVLFIAWFAPFFSSKVKWRGGKISIGERTLLVHAIEKGTVEGV